MRNSLNRKLTFTCCMSASTWYMFMDIQECRKYS